MEYDKTDIQPNGTLSPRPQPVSHTFCVAGLFDTELSGALTFASVLNLPVSYEIWPGDITICRFSDRLAELLVGKDYVYVQSDEHLGFYRRSDNSSTYTVYPNTVGEADGDIQYAGHITLDGENVIDYWASDCSDDDEPDTLNSELLLTEVYIDPEKSGTLDSVNLQLRRPVRVILPLDAHKPIAREE